MQALDQKDLAKRWLISPRTLEQWRWQGRGPRYLKIGGRVIYPLAEVEAFEAANLHMNTVGPIEGGENHRAGGAERAVGTAPETVSQPGALSHVGCSRANSRCETEARRLRPCRTAN